MQEEVERRAIAISLTAGKFTARTLAKALEAALRQMREQHNKSRAPQGRQSVNVSRIPLDGSTRLFDRVARKYNVDYAFRKTGPKQYRLYFKAGQADAITDCFAEYTKRAMRKSRPPSVLKQMEQAKQAARQQHTRERKREAVRGDR